MIIRIYNNVCGTHIKTFIEWYLRMSLILFLSQADIFIDASTISSFCFALFSFSKPLLYFCISGHLEGKNTSGYCNYLPAAKTVTVATRILQNKSSTANLKFPALVSLTMFSINNFVTCFCELSFELPSPAMIQYALISGKIGRLWREKVLEDAMK